jgi:hypothetical protein
MPSLLSIVLRPSHEQFALSTSGVLASPPDAEITLDETK